MNWFLHVHKAGDYHISENSHISNLFITKENTSWKFLYIHKQGEEVFEWHEADIKKGLKHVERFLDKKLQPSVISRYYMHMVFNQLKTELGLSTRMKRHNSLFSVEKIEKTCSSSTKDNLSMIGVLYQLLKNGFEKLAFYLLCCSGLSPKKENKKDFYSPKP